MIFGREEVSEIVPAERTGGVLRPQVKRNSQGFHDIRAADGRGAGAVAVLGDQHPRRRRQERDGRGDVKGAQAIAAGADNVEDFMSAGFGIERWGNGFVAQGAGEGGDFAGGFAFFRQRGQEIGLDRGWNFFIGELFHRPADLLVVERSRRAELLSEFFEHRGMLSFVAAGSNRKCA